MGGVRRRTAGGQRGRLWPAQLRQPARQQEAPRCHQSYTARQVQGEHVPRPDPERQLSARLQLHFRPLRRRNGQVSKQHPTPSEVTEKLHGPCRYRKSRKLVTPLKNHLNENKTYPPQNDEYYTAIANPTVSPITIPTVVSLPGMSYDMPYNQTYPNNTSHYSAPQPVYAPTNGPYHSDIYGALPQNVMLTNNGQFISAHPDYTATTTMAQQPIKFTGRNDWEQMVRIIHKINFFLKNSDPIILGS